MRLFCGRLIGRKSYMFSINTVMLGNCRGSDGVYAFDREILFSSAGKWVADALPRSLISEVFYIKGEAAQAIDGLKILECPTAERYSFLLSCDELLDAENIMILASPMPELTTADYEKLINAHKASGYDVTVLCCDGGVSEEFAIVRNMDDEFESIGHGEGERALHAAVFKTTVLKTALSKEPETLFSVINMAAEDGAGLGVCKVRSAVQIVTGRNAYTVQKKMMERINFGLIDKGVVIMAPESTYIASDAEIGAGTVILPGTIIKQGCKIGSNAVIGPNSLLDRAVIGDDTAVNASQVYESTVGKGATVGPFAYIRPDCVVGDNTRIGDFVELKKSTIGNGTKVSHLTYIGDAHVGERVNFGCGTVVVNYDGYHKNLTTIGDDCFIGCNTNLVSPVSLGDKAFTAAGTTVTKDVPDGALAVGRAKQENIADWNFKRRKKHGQDK